MYAHTYNTHIIGIRIRIRTRITHIAPIVGIMPGEMANGQEHHMHAEKKTSELFTHFKYFSWRTACKFPLGIELHGIATIATY